MSRTHNHRSRRHSEQLYGDVHLKPWAHGPPHRYWKVDGGISITSPELDTPLALLEVIHQQEISRTAKGTCEMFSASLEPERVGLERLTPWMNRTQWAGTYKGVRRDILSRLSYIGNLHFHNLDSHIGLRGDLDITSPRFNEQRIVRLIDAVDRMFDRCEETMGQTGQPSLRWLRSTTSNQRYRTPFGFMSRNSSRRKYRRCWKRLVAFAFRVYRITFTLQHAMLGSGLTQRQLDAL